MILVANKADLESERVVSVGTNHDDSVWFTSIFFPFQVSKVDGDEVAQQLKVSVKFFS